MDIRPEQINPDIIEIGKANPIVREYFELYLSEAPIIDGQPLTWAQALELMVLKLSEQYGGALEGWKDAVKKKSIHPALLVNESEPMPREVSEAYKNLAEAGVFGNPESHTVEAVEVQSPEAVQLEIAKGMLAKLISPARRAYAAAGGKHEDAPAVSLTKSFVEQVDALLEGKVDEYIQAAPCPVCQSNAWLIEDGKPKCQVCEVQKSRRSENNKVQQLTLGIRELLSQNDVKSIPDRLRKLIPDLPLSALPDAVVRQAEIMAKFASAETELRDIQGQMADTLAKSKK